MSCWERLLLSSVPDTASWPPRFDQKYATTPLTSPPRRLPKQSSRALAPATLSSFASAARATKRRPSILGGGFSTAGVPSMSSDASKNNSCPWGDYDANQSASEWLPPHDIALGASRPGRRGSKPESLGSEEIDDDDNDGNDRRGIVTTTDISVIGWGDRCRRRSTLRASREGAVERND
ncbi:unnamed protein product, partial [Hapterophycus canaliculatus]